MEAAIIGVGGAILVTLIGFAINNELRLSRLETRMDSLQSLVRDGFREVWESMGTHEHLPDGRVAFFFHTLDSASDPADD